MWVLLIVVGRYAASPAEREWHGEITGRICDIARSPSQIKSMQLALQHDPAHLSYVDGHPIEPLTGIARHPFAEVGCDLPHETSIYDISYLMIKDHCKRVHPRFTAKFMDMGCTDFLPTHTASGLGPSMPLFINMYNKSCVQFDELWGWEAQARRNWWEFVPLHLKPRIHFYNTPVSAVEFRHALALCKPSDFVVVKLDIDTVLVEMQIIQVIEVYAHLVDELFFEYHFYYDSHDFGWGALGGSKSKHNATAAINLMLRLRQRGVRAHFWI
jgi:hypothetical protein